MDAASNEKYNVAYERDLIKLEGLDLDKEEEEDFKVNYSSMDVYMSERVKGLALEAVKFSKFDKSNIDKSRYIKNELEKSLGGHWVVFVGEDFGAVFSGKEFSKGTLIHFTLNGTGFMLYQCKKR